MNEWKILKIADRVVTALEREQHPEVYVTTYEKHEAELVKGQWVDLTQFNNYDEFYAYCLKINSDKPDPSIRYLDAHNVPDVYYDERNETLSADVFDYIKVIQNHDKDAVDAVIGNDYSLKQAEHASIYKGCRSMRDVAMTIAADNEERISDKAWRYSFDYRRYGLDSLIDQTDSEDNEYANMSDEEAGYEMVKNEYGGLSHMGSETVKQYVDYDKLGEWLDDNGEWIKYEDGYVEINNDFDEGNQNE